MMSDFIKIGPGEKAPDEVNVVIEIPSHSDPIKYEVDKETGALRVDRFIGTAMYYPCNYGYVPGTLSEDGDPVDVLVVTPFPLLVGCVICCRAIGMLPMKDEAGVDAKILAVPIPKLSPIYDNIKTWEDFPKQFTQSIKHFFEHYKELEEGKWVEVKDWLSVQAAKEEIQISIKKAKEKNRM